MSGHGNRTTYVDGCHCAECREANRLYYHVRKEWVNGYVPVPFVSAGRARRHIGKLRHSGLGVRAIARAAGMSRSSLQKIIDGKTRRVRRVTQDRLLAVSSADRLGASLVDASETWDKIDWLLTHGWTKQRISAAIGQNGVKLQVGRSLVQERTAAKVRRLYLTERRSQSNGSGTGGVQMANPMVCEICSVRLSEHPIRACWREEAARVS